MSPDQGSIDFQVLRWSPPVEGSLARDTGLFKSGSAAQVSLK